MSRWSSQRKAIIITYILLLAIIGVAIFYFLVIYQAPSCYDDIRNGAEEGVDCGGGCPLVCSFSTTQPNIFWTRAFEVAPGVYNLAAEVENPNFQVGTTITYVFQAYNEENVLVEQITNQISLAPTEKRIIFEPAVETGNQAIARVFLEFKEDEGWYSSPKITERVVVQDYLLENTETTPSLQVNLRNTDIRDIGPLTVTAVLYDREENVEQVSQTFIEGLKADDTGQAFFSWRQPFENSIQSVSVFVLEPR